MGGSHLLFLFHFLLFVVCSQLRENTCIDNNRNTNRTDIDLSEWCFKLTSSAHISLAVIEYGGVYVVGVRVYVEKLCWYEKTLHKILASIFPAIYFEKKESHPFGRLNGFYKHRFIAYFSLKYAAQILTRTRTHTHMLELNRRSNNITVEWAHWKANIIGWNEPIKMEKFWISDDIRKTHFRNWLRNFDQFFISLYFLAHRRAYFRFISMCVVKGAFNWSIDVLQMGADAMCLKWTIRIHIIEIFLHQYSCKLRWTKQNAHVIHGRIASFATHT